MAKSAANNESPLLTQYRRIKRENAGNILFFRLGDFYEMFAEDAVEVSALLNLTLTSRNGLPMCGVPYHAARRYIARLLKCGKKIAICEQLGAPQKGKAVIEREVVEVITPGTAVDEYFLEAGEQNFLACLCGPGGPPPPRYGFAYLDLSTGRFEALSFAARDAPVQLRAELERLAVKELIVQESVLENSAINITLENRPTLVLNRWTDWLFDAEKSFDLLTRQFGTENLKGFGIEKTDCELLAAGALLEYLAGAKKALLPHIRKISRRADDDFCGIDESTLRNLELLRGAGASGGSGGFSLLETLDETKTAMGRRLLKERVSHPLRSAEKINRRLDFTAALYHNQALLSTLRELLSRTGDLERHTSRLAMRRSHGKDMLALKNALFQFQKIEELLCGGEGSPLATAPCGSSATPLSGGDSPPQRPPAADSANDNFVKNSSGGIDFGEITLEIAAQIERPAGYIRLRCGEHNNKKNKGRGKKHIDRRLAELQANNYLTTEALVEDVSQNYDAIYDGNDKIAKPLVLVKRGVLKEKVICVVLTKIENEDFYDVTTGLVSRKKYFKNKKLLWENPQSSFCKSESATAHYLQRKPASFGAIMDNPDASLSHILEKKSIPSNAFKTGFDTSALEGASKLIIAGLLKKVNAAMPTQNPKPETQSSEPLFESNEARTFDGWARLAGLCGLLERALCEEPSVLLTEGKLIQKGYNGKLDALHELRDNGRGMLEAYLEEERQSTGISSLKIRYNRLIGYFFEVTNVHLNKIPAHFIRRQGIAGGERFSTEHLARLESDINGAEDKIIELEKELFLELREEAAALLPEISAAAQRLAELDAAASLATAATLRGWTRPVVDDENRLIIEEGRHPVVEAHLPRGEFIPNDTVLAGDSGECGGRHRAISGEAYPHHIKNISFALITGPNMAGKSTYLRQSALVAVMAQMGSFVPARRAEVGIADRVYCRVGAQDNLARGESTFLVEMNETAFILNTATERSLVIMDEVGRGTGTLDGLSIAQAVCEALLDRVRCRTLFATHYHELAVLAHPRLAQRSMLVEERGGEIIFRRRLVEGPAAESYGLHVARIAGLDEAVCKRAEEIMRGLRNSGQGAEPGGQVARSEGQAARAAGSVLISKLLSMKSVADVPKGAIRVERKAGGGGAKKIFLEAVDSYFVQNNIKTVRRGNWSIAITRSGIASSLEHGFGSRKIDVFTAVPSIIQKGIITEKNTNWKGRGYDSYIIDASVTWGGEDCIAEVIINHHADGAWTFYLHEVEEKSKLHSAFTSGYNTSALEGASKLNIAKKIYAVKPPVKFMATPAAFKPAAKPPVTHIADEEQRGLFD